MSEETNQQETPPEQTPEQQPEQQTPSPTGGLAERLLQPPENNADPNADPWEGDGWKGLIPDKFKTAEGEVDLKNLAKSYLHAEKRIGSGDVPPKDETGYKMEVQFPEGVEVDAERQTAFLKGCHASGMTNKQVNYVMGKYADMIAEAQQQMATINTDAETVLRKEWGDGFDTQMTLAQKAFHAVASEEDKANAGKLAKDPVIIRMLAKLGANLKEDPGLPPEISGMQPEDLDALMKSPAYWDAKHPDHMKVKNQVTRYFEVTSRKKAA